MVTRELWGHRSPLSSALRNVKPVRHEGLGGGGCFRFSCPTAPRNYLLETHDVPCLLQVRQHRLQTSVCPSSCTASRAHARNSDEHQVSLILPGAQIYLAQKTHCHITTGEAEIHSLVGMALCRLQGPCLSASFTMVLNPPDAVTL